jgi:putative flagellar protein fliS
LVNNLCPVDDKWLFAATQAGVISINLHTQKTELRHKGENIRKVAFYDGHLCILSDNQLTIENINGADSKHFPLPQSVLSFYKAGSTYYFITSSRILLSDNLERFVSIPLRNNVPDNPHRIAIADDGNGFSILLTKNALWRIPHHLGIFNANPPVVAACRTGNDLIYVNNQHELFRQKADELIAKKVYDFEDDELPKEMFADGEDIYYYTANNQVFRLNIGEQYLINQLFKRPQLLTQPRTRITSMALLSHENKLLLGVQDYLLSVDCRNGKTDTVKSMNNRYITAFHQSQESGKIYISTLNHGVFVSKGKQVERIAGTEHMVFVNSLCTYNSPRPRLLLLTNHYLQIQGADSIRTDGSNQIFCINDSIVYTIPEMGIHKYKIKNNRLYDCGSFFDDIHFNAQAAFSLNNTLYIGSDLGVIQLTPGKEEAAKWVTFDNKAPSLQLIGIILFTMMSIIGIILFSYRRHKTLTYRQLQLSKDDLRHRLEALAGLKDRLTENEQNTLEAISNEIETINISSQSLRANNELFANLSARIARLNRDTALQMVKFLNEQIDRIHQYEVYECSQMIHDSEEARSTDNIEIIIEQCKKNEVWLNHIQEIKERLDKFYRSTEGTLVLSGLNDGMRERLQHIQEATKHLTIAEVYPDFIVVKEQYENIFTPKGLKVIRDYISASIAQLQRLKGYEEMAESLLNELQTIEKDIDNRDRIVLLRLLQTIDNRITQIKYLNTLQQLIEEYTTIHDNIKKENEERRMKKFHSKLFADIDSATRDVTDQIAQISEQFFISFATTDKEVCQEIFHFTSVNSQQVRVLILLLAMPRVKRTLLPGMLGIYGNLNPVVSRLYHSKIGDNKTLLDEYCKRNTSSIVNYIIKLSE